MVTSERAARRGRVAELYRAGLGHRAIADRLGVGHATVSRDLAWLRAAGVDLPTRRPGASTSATGEEARCRVEQGLSQRELADRAGVSEVTVMALEHGRLVRPQTRGTVRRALGLTVTDPAPAGLSDRDARRLASAVGERCAAVAALFAAGAAPTGICLRLGISRATLYRDLAAARALGVRIAGRPIGRPLG